jgi:hypothetical protein
LKIIDSIQADLIERELTGTNLAAETASSSENTANM